LPRALVLLILLSLLARLFLILLLLTGFLAATLLLLTGLAILLVRILVLLVHSDQLLLLNPAPTTAARIGCRNNRFLRGNDAAVRCSLHGKKEPPAVAVESGT
jgi:hypothetical protein